MTQDTREAERRKWDDLEERLLPENCLRNGVDTEALCNEARLALRDAREEGEKLQREAEHWKQLFDECAIARDASGFLGTVPQCIAHWEGCATSAEAALDLIRDALKALDVGYLERKHAVAIEGDFISTVRKVLSSCG